MYERLSIRDRLEPGAAATCLGLALGAIFMLVGGVLAGGHFKVAIIFVTAGLCGLVGVLFGQYFADFFAMFVRLFGLTLSAALQVDLVDPDDSWIKPGVAFVLFAVVFGIVIIVALH